MVEFLLPCPVHQSEPGVNRHWAWHFLTQPGPQLADVNMALVAWFMVKTWGKTMLTMEWFVGKKNFCFNMVLINCNIL